MVNLKDKLHGNPTEGSITNQVAVIITMRVHANVYVKIMREVVVKVLQPLKDAMDA